MRIDQAFHATTPNGPAPFLAMPARTREGQPSRSVVACVDCNGSGEAILRQAIAAAKDLGLSVDAVRVIEASSHDRAPSDPLQWQVRRRESLDRLERLVTTAGGDPAAMKCVLLRGNAADEITSWASRSKAALIVMGMHGDAGQGLGATAQRVLERAGVSLLLLPVSSRRNLPYRRILVPLDGSMRAESVLPVAVRIARGNRAEIHLVHVITRPTAFGSSVGQAQQSGPCRQLAEQNERAARAYLQRLENRLRKEGVAVRSIVSSNGDPRPELRRLAIDRHADLIIAGSHGCSGMMDVPCGSVTDYLAKHAPAPLLIVRPDFAPAFTDLKTLSARASRKLRVRASVMTEWSRELARPLASAALSLAEHCCDFEQPPAPIPALENIQAALGWLHSARLACADASPEVEKAAEWLLDNDYQVHRAIRQIRQDLPASFYSRLPVLCDPGTPRFPRVFALAHELLRVTQLQVSLASSVTFVNAYQERQPLTIAELWAFPTMLRIACLEIIVAALTPMLPGVARPFVPTARAADPHSLDDTGRVARGIANLAVIAAIPWEEFFDSTSLVEKILKGDPSGFYGQGRISTPVTTAGGP
jgi:nucleotide-binding universal stress UspA family protein